ncbi:MULTISPECIES: peptidase S10 [Paraburkholderia]|uniref:S10 family serine carboxypeptidase-like protein n=1 Tax=Paraburkholderia TaxID=1822464 RepID=UPI002252A752|nr:MULTISPECIES: peptidase S10 [Paraburkholderia]MCX4165304.1 peptidase S10 [Paraburkholderia megapolitana]MDN7160796.1 peptidase S10 [Paraburkholderia sp. CHISQ3]MDQ6497843.1 peptidase S10 [Paraburkholderia megapolitana]
MKPDRSCNGSKQGRLAALSIVTIGMLALAGCGGSDGGSSSSSAANLKQTSNNQANPAASNQPYVDTIAYSMNATDGLAASQVTEKAAVMQHQWKSGSTTIDYTTTTGHLTAADAQGNPEASMSYVAYTAPSTNGAPRPVTFIYNGGPGSSSIWLRLGSFAPTRVATPDPLFGNNWPNYPLVDNKESMLDVSDLVYIDPPGTGLSEAVLPNTNQVFWGCDPDVKVIRDFVERYIAVNNRSKSPLYLYGESYGTPRTDMLALSLESAGVHLTGIVLQSSILNYGSTDDVADDLPSYAEVSAYYNQVSPAPVSLSAYAQQMEQFSTAQYRHLNNGTPPLRTLQSWSQTSGMSVQALQSYFSQNWFSDTLVSNGQIGRYDGRVTLPDSDPRLQSDNDPSDILISQPFTNALATQMPQYLGYTAPNSTYVPLNDGMTWDFSHGGQSYPDTIPDLLGALTLNPRLEILSENGYHDLATPFFNTEKQLARLQTVPHLNPNLQVNFVQGGHMIYLDDVARPQVKAHLKLFYAAKQIPGALTLTTLPQPWRDESPASSPTVSTPSTVTQAAAP